MVGKKFMTPVFEMSDEEREFFKIRIGTHNIDKYADVIFGVINDEFNGLIKYSANGVKRGFIMPDGRFIDLKGKPHYWLEDEIVDYFDDNEEYVLSIKFDTGGLGLNIFDMLGCIRVNGDNENYIGLPSNKWFNEITPAQRLSLKDWLDYYFYTINKLEIRVATPDRQQVTYSRNEYEPKEIIQKINRYYNAGVLYESKIK